MTITGPHEQGEYNICDLSGFAIVSVWPTVEGLPHLELAEAIVRLLEPDPRQQSFLEGNQ